MRPAICDILGIEAPILAFSHCRDVVAAVSNAGGFGVLGATSHTPEMLERELTWIDDHVRGRPYGVDVVIPEKLAGTAAGDLASPEALAAMIPAEHRAYLDELMDRFGLPRADSTSEQTSDIGANLAGAGAERLLDVAFSHDIKLIANALGPAPSFLVDRARAHGVPVAGLVGSVKHARAQIAGGVDVIIAQGYEAGGHTGEITTMVLTPEVVDAVSPVPVLAAGGIATGRQVAAALALGAAGVWCGSVWLTTTESSDNPAVVDKLLAAGSGDTLRSRSRTGKPARQLRSAWTDAWESPQGPGPLPMPLQMLLTRAAWDRIDKGSDRGDPGAIKLVNEFVGQAVTFMRSRKSAMDVVFEMMEEYVSTVERLSEQLQDDGRAGSR